MNLNACAAPARTRTSPCMWSLKDRRLSMFYHKNEYNIKEMMNQFCKITYTLAQHLARWVVVIRFVSTVTSQKTSQSAINSLYNASRISTFLPGARIGKSAVKEPSTNSKALQQLTTFFGKKGGQCDKRRGHTWSHHLGQENEIIRQGRIKYGRSIRRRTRVVSHSLLSFNFGSWRFIQPWRDKLT